jgi:hypothetical protein
MEVAGALGYDFASVLVDGADLGDAVYGFLDLGVGFEQHLEEPYGLQCLRREVHEGGQHA